MHSQLTHQIIASAITVHHQLGPGLLENVYKECLCHQLLQSGLSIQKEKPIPVTFNNLHLNCGYRLDLLVENKVVIEVKSVAELSNLHLAQTLTYLRLGKYPLGLLINFNVLRLVDGVRRVSN